jgi:hypothetical protein
MSQKGRWLVLTVIASACLILTSTAWAQQPEDTFWVNYFSNNGTVAGYDQEVRIINPGAYAPSYPPSDLCAMVYVFDNTQELTECCGCLITTNGLLEASVKNDLTSNTFNGTVPANGDIKIVSAPSNFSFTYYGTTYPGCDPTGGGLGSNGKYALNIAPTPDLRSWSTHLPGYLKPDLKTTEDEFEPATLSTAELDGLQEQCTNILTVGSGAGWCGEDVYSSSGYCDDNPYNLDDTKAQARRKP